MSHYKSNIRDIEFNLFEVLGVDAELNDGRYGDLDADTARQILGEVARLAEGPVASSYREADREPVVFDAENHEVVVPDPLRKTIVAVKEAGWSRLGLPAEVGGVPAPKPLAWAVREMLLAANPAAGFFDLGAEMANVLYEIGNEQQKRWAQRALELGWAATMVLTEADAGSDVGAGRTRALPQADGTWHIEGVKRFISGGDVGDTAENLFHLVLARPDGAGAGTKGLSLFFVPKFHFDPDSMQLGDRNGVFVTGVEDKMGIKSSPTCEVTFGGALPAVGWLVGDTHNGIAQMFRVIENARMTVGTKSAGMLSTGYLNALEFARLRVQGADLTQMSNKTAPRVTIINHPEVRRSLMLQKSYAEGLRSLYMFAAVHQDPVATLAQRVSGADPDLADQINDLLLPIIKGVGSERAYDVLKYSLQTFGGSGYLRDYPLEQYVRDTLIDTLYEGTTAIQAQDLLFRKITRNDARTLEYLLKLIEDFAETGDGRLAGACTLLAVATEDVRCTAGILRAHAQAAREDPARIYKAALGAVPFLFALGDLLIGWRLLDQAGVALAAMDGGVAGDACEFYRGKVAVADYFAKHVLPGISATRSSVSNTDGTLMEIGEFAF